MHIAAGKGFLENVNCLVALGARVDITNTKAMTPIHKSSYQGNAKCVECLLAAEPHLVNARDEDEGTALHAAADNGHRDVINVLIARGADPSLTDGKGRTAWDIARQKSGQSKNKKEKGGVDKYVECMGVLEFAK